MKKISATYIFPGSSAPIKKGVIVVGDNGEILDLLDPLQHKINWEEVEQHQGIICPGFINTHCHLELSYLKGKITERQQLVGFIKELVTVRENFTEDERKIAIEKAEQEMITNGIVAVGDISNDDTSFFQKAKKSMKYYTFLEVFGTNTAIADTVIEDAKKLKSKYFNKCVSIVPHAPYSMSSLLVEKVAELKEEIISIHNQETEGENTLIEKATGELLALMQKFAPEMNAFKATGKSSLLSYLPHYFGSERILLVHNTFTKKEDVEFTRTAPIAVFWCFCPNANEYIEGKQPNYELFLNEKCTIGTDSLASNWSLSILDELKTISQKNPNIPLETLIKWATFNGAQFLGFDDLGSIAKGKSPGLNLIVNVDLERICFEKKSRIIPLLKFLQ